VIGVGYIDGKLKGKFQNGVELQRIK
jgi:hypothetical protein